MWVELKTYVKRHDPMQLGAGLYPGQETAGQETAGQKTAGQRAARAWVPPPHEATCVVRASTPADIPAITSIYGRFVSISTATFELVAPDQAEMAARRKALLDRGLPHLVAELDGYVVGFCYASQFRPREGYRYTVEDSIYVRADCVGHGVGRKLLAELVERCRECGCHVIVACICGVNPASVALHGALGFEEVGVVREAGNKFGEWLSLLMMQRRLG